MALSNTALRDIVKGRIDRTDLAFLFSFVVERSSAGAFRTDIVSCIPVGSIRRAEG